MIKKKAPKSHTTVEKHALKVHLRKHRWKLLIIAIFLLVSLGMVLQHELTRPKVYYIAYIGRDQTEGFDDLHVIAIEKYLNEINEKLSGVRLRLKRLSNKIDDHNNDSTKVYEKIADDESIVSVIDNTWARHLKPVADIIRNRDLPVIATNADKQEKDYARHVVFLGYEDGTPLKVVAYTKKILNRNKAIFITESKYGLTEQFLDQFSKQQLAPDIIRVNDENVNEDEKIRLFSELDSKLDGQMKSFSDKQEPIPVIINTHGYWGNEIIHHIETNYDHVTMLGGPYIIIWKTYKEINNDDSDLDDKNDAQAEKNNPYNTKFGKNLKDNKLILFTYPTDAVTKKVYNDLNKIRPSVPGVQRDDDQLYVKRCLDAVTIIREAIQDMPRQKSGLTITRKTFLDYFLKLANGTNIATTDDLYSFNKNLLLEDQRTFEQHHQGTKSSCVKQLNPAGDKEIANIFFGLDNLLISKIDVEHRTFHVDFYFWLTYDKRHPESENHVVFRNEIRSHDGPRQPVVGDQQDKDTERKTFKESADFSLDTDFERYPFDSQELTIEVDLVAPTDALTISLDRETLKRSRETHAFYVNEWQSKGFYVTVDNLVSNSFLGNSKPQYKKPQKYKSVNVRIPISRRWTSPIVTIVLPLFMIGLAAIALLYVKDNSFANIGEVCVGVFLSIVTYSIAYSEITPRTNVLTIADQLFYGTFFTVLLIFLKVIFFNSNIISERVRHWKRARSSIIGHVALTIYCMMIALVIVLGLI